MSGVLSTDINLPFITADDGAPVHFDASLSRAEFDRITADLVQATVDPIDIAMRDAGVTNADIEKILLVGGSFPYSCCTNINQKQVW